MCVMSSIGDYARDTMPGRYQNILPQIPQQYYQPLSAIQRYEFDALKKEVEELKILLTAAKRYDEKTGQHECEQAEKVAFLKKIAEFVGVDLGEVLGSDASSP